MNRKRDLSMAQRLSLGFGSGLLVVGVLIALFYDWHRQASRAQAAYSERIAPLRDGMHALERETYQASIALRTVLIFARQEHAQAFGEHVERSRTRFTALGDLPMEEDGQALYADIAQALQAYFEAAEAVVARRMSGQLASRDDEIRLSELRGELTGLANRFGLLQEYKAQDALQAIGQLRQRISRAC